MAFTATPQDGSSPTPIPMSSAVPDGTNTPLAIEGGPSITTGGNTLVPVSMYVKDGNNIALGVSTDAANVNSVIGQLKQIKTNTTLGSATSANSLPVVVASDQASIAVTEACIVSTVNSSTATLTANSVFTGTSESALPFSALSVEVFSDQASAAGGLSVQQSQNGTNWDTVDTFSVVASTAFNTTVNLIGQFFRVVYTNGTTNQATFRLQTIKQPVDVVLPRTLTAAGNLKVDGSGVTQPVSGTVTVNALPTGASTIGAVTQASGPWTNNITQVGGSAITLGSKTSANSYPVVIASDQAAMPMSQSGTWTMQPGNTANTTPWLATVNQGGNSATVTASNALKVDASATTQPVSGTVTMNAGTGTMNVSQLAAGSVSGTLQTAQAGNAVGTPLSLLGMGVAVLTVNMAGFTGTVNFEGQEDGTNFGALNAVQIGTNTITSTAVGSTSTSIARYEIPVAGLQQIQARTSGVSAGTVTVTAHAVPVPYNGKVINANQAGTWNVGLTAGAAVIGSTTIQATSGTALVADQTNSELRVSNYVTKTTAGDTALTLGQATMANSLSVALASNQGNVPIQLVDSGGTNKAAIDSAGNQAVKGGFTEIAGQGTGVVNGTNTDLIPSTDVSAYKWWSLQIAGTWVGRFTFQCSNDNVNFVPFVASSVQTQSTTGTSTTINDIVGGPIYFRFLRIRMTTFTSNTSAVGTLELYTSPAQMVMSGVLANQSGTWTTGLANGDLTAVASAAYTTTQTQTDQTNTAARGVRAVLDMTAVGTGSVTLEIDAKDVASGKYVAMLTGAAVTTNSTNTYVVYPGLTAVANSIASDILPKTWRIKVTATNANSATYSVGASYLL